MSLAHAQATGEGLLLLQYVNALVTVSYNLVANTTRQYNLLHSWAGYLVNATLVTDDHEYVVSHTRRIPQ